MFEGGSAEQSFSEDLQLDSLAHVQRGPGSRDIEIRDPEAQPESNGYKRDEHSNPEKLPHRAADLFYLKSGRCCKLELPEYRTRILKVGDKNLVHFDGAAVQQT